MKVLAFNSSPKTDKGNTSLILLPFLEGMKEAGAEVELFYTRKLNVNPCMGEANCNLKHPGRCYQDDDMNMLLPKILAADVMVLASPLYFDGLNGPMKNLMDRMLPLGRAAYEMRDGHLRLGLYEGFKPKKVVLVSTCGLWEMDNFDSMLAHMKAACRSMASEFAGALLRPHANFISTIEPGGAMSDIFDSAKRAGHELVREGKMSGDALQNVSRELMPLDVYRQETNNLLTHLQEKAKAG